MACLRSLLASSVTCLRPGLMSPSRKMRRVLKPGGRIAFPRCADEVELVLSKDWIGDLSSIASVASTIEKLGVNLFITKGLTPTFTERIVSAVREDGIKELIKLIYAIILAGMLFYLGWKVS